MLNANIDALSFLNALATTANVTAGTYGSLLSVPVTMQQVLQAEVTALNQPGSDATAELNALAAQITGSPQVALGQLFDLGVWQDVGIGSVNTPAALSAGLNAFQLASLAAQVANGSHFVTLSGLGITLPGIAQVTAAATAIEPPQGPAFAFGPAGVTVHTAQVRVQLQVTLLNTSALLGGVLSGLANVSVSIPLYVEVASGTATLSQISCGTDPQNDATVTIQATPAAANRLSRPGTVNRHDEFHPGRAAARSGDDPERQCAGPGPGKCHGLGGCRCRQPGPTSLVFTQTQMQETPPATQTTASTDMLSTLSSGLSNSLNLTTTVAGLPLPIAGLTTALTTALTPVFQGVDGLVDPLLAALGIRIGYMDVTATGVRCGVPTLVD